MRRLVTGDRGHIGAVLTPMPTAVGHEVVRLEASWYDGCDSAEPELGVQREGVTP